jgi:flagellar biosynthetic protein FliO
MLMIKALILMLGGLCVSALASAADQVPGPTDLSTAGIKMVVALCLIVGLLLLASYVVNKTHLFGKSLRGKTRSMEIIETLYLGPKRSLALIKVGEACIVVGMTPTSISCLARLDQPGPGAVHDNTMHHSSSGAHHQGESSIHIGMQSDHLHGGDTNGTGFESVLHSLMNRVKAGSDKRKSSS